MKKMETFNVLFVSRGRRIADTEIQTEALYARITVGGKRCEISLGYTLPTGSFNNKAQRCLSKTKESKNANDFLSLVSFRLNECRKELYLEGIEVTCENIKKKYKGLSMQEEKPIPTILELYESHNVKLKELIGIDVAEATYQRHVTSKQHVKLFVGFKYGVPDLPVDRVDYKFLKDYEHYFKTVRKCNHNSTMKYIKNLGKVLRIAIAEGYLTHNPFDKMKLTYQTVEREILTHDELDKLVNLKISEARLDRVRDMFIFCAFTGLAFIDLVDLRMEHIHKDKEGTLWIKNKRMKTKNEFMVPLLPIPIKILNKYKNHPERQNADKVVPSIVIFGQSDHPVPIQIDHALPI